VNCFTLGHSPAPLHLHRTLDCFLRHITSTLSHTKRFATNMTTFTPLHVPARFRELEKEFAAAAGAYVACERMNQLTVNELRFCRELINNNAHARSRARVGVLVVSPDSSADAASSPLLLFFSTTTEHKKTSWLRAELVRLLLLGGAHRIRTGEPCRVRRLALWLQMRVLTSTPKQISAQATYKYLQQQHMLEPRMQKPGNFLWLWKQVLQLTSKKLDRLSQTLEHLQSERHTIESWSRAPAPLTQTSSRKRKFAEDADSPSSSPSSATTTPQMMLHEERMHDDVARQEALDATARPAKQTKLHHGMSAAKSTKMLPEKRRLSLHSQARRMLHPPPPVKSLFRAHAAAMRKRISLFDDVVRRPSIRQLR
jgi:hypothetical protein